MLNALTTMLDVENSEFRSAMRAASGADIVEMMPQVFIEIAKVASRADNREEWLEYIRNLSDYGLGKRDTMPFGPKRIPEHYWQEYRAYCEKLLKQFGEHHRSKKE